MDRNLDIFRSPFPSMQSRFGSGQSGFSMQPWEDRSSQWRAMNQYIREMEQEMDRMFQSYRSERPMPMDLSSTFDTRANLNSPTPGLGPDESGGGRFSPNTNRSLVPVPFPPLSQQFENWGIKNPISTEPDGSRKLKVQFDLRQYKPEEINVKVKDGMVEIHARHEEISDHGKAYREYHRHFNLPGEVVAENLKCKLQPDGILALEAPLPQKGELQREQNIPIQFG